MATHRIRVVQSYIVHLETVMEVEAPDAETARAIAAEMDFPGHDAQWDETYRELSDYWYAVDKGEGV